MESLADLASDRKHSHLLNDKKSDDVESPSGITDNVSDASIDRDMTLLRLATTTYLLALMYCQFLLRSSLLTGILKQRRHSRTIVDLRRLYPKLANGGKHKLNKGNFRISRGKGKSSKSFFATDSDIRRMNVLLSSIPDASCLEPQTKAIKTIEFGRDLGINYERKDGLIVNNFSQHIIGDIQHWDSLS
ncbi:hypothetical protein GH714_030992 [Hevea brasiliensis]|uniref:Uncharacterized protein n=1 Tax=Hevea brasiliensis TaxID=3981 RepID=A0A6A6K9K4_HEVBR|nr:hypothetical protein GH714_030992 [Hevea brasiliensis]